MHAGILIALGVLASAAQAQQQSVSVRVKFEGAPLPNTSARRRDQEGLPPDHSLLVSSKGGLANVVITLDESVPRGVATTHHWKVVDGEAEPRILKMEPGDTVEVSSDDDRRYSFAVHPYSGREGNFIPPPFSWKFSENEPLPFEMTCNLQPWFKAWIVVSDSVYAISDKVGKCELPLKVSGKRRIKVWHERRSELEFQIGEKQLTRSSAEVNLTPGGTLTIVVRAKPAVKRTGIEP
jgi:hypothetical protein